MHNSVILKKRRELSQYSTPAVDSFLPFCHMLLSSSRWKPPMCFLSLWFCLSQSVTWTVLYRVPLASGFFCSAQHAWDSRRSFCELVVCPSCWAVARCMAVSPFVRPVTRRRTFGLIPILVITNNTVINRCVLGFLWTKVFISLGWISPRGIAVSDVDYMYNFVRNCQTPLSLCCHFQMTPFIYVILFNL